MGKKSKGNEPATENGPIAYDATRVPAWTDAVDSWVWSDRDGEAAAKSGPCQRCGHTIGFVDQPGIVALMLKDNRPGAGSSRKYAACNCGVKHSGGPEGETGCGANGLIKRADHASAVGGRS